MGKTTNNDGLSTAAQDADKLQVCGTIPAWLAREFRKIGGDRSRLVAGAVYSYVCMKANLQRQFEGEALGERPSLRENWETMYLGVEHRLLRPPDSPPETKGPERKKKG